MDTLKQGIYIDFDFSFMSLRSECIMELMPNPTPLGLVYTKALYNLSSIILLAFSVFYLIIMMIKGLTY
jgi:hypothetical protein